MKDSTTPVLTPNHLASAPLTDNRQFESTGPCRIVRAVTVCTEKRRTCVALELRPHEMYGLPSVITPLPVRGKGPTEIAGGKCGDVVADPELLGGALKSKKRLTHFIEQIGVRSEDPIRFSRPIVGDLCRVRIIAADGHEKDLAFHVQLTGTARLDQASDHPELVAEGTGREWG